MNGKLLTSLCWVHVADEQREVTETGVSLQVLLQVLGSEASETCVSLQVLEQV